MNEFGYLEKPLICVLVLFVALSGCTGPVDRIESTNKENTITNSPKSIETTSSQMRESTSDTPTDVVTTRDQDEDVEETESIQTQPDPENWSQERKYDYFSDNYTDLIDKTDVINTTIRPENNSMDVIYEVSENPDVANNQTLEVIVSYASLVDIYVDSSDHEDFDESWVPKHVNVKSVSATGEEYQTGYLKYEWAYRWKIGDGWEDSKVSDRVAYTFEFYNTTSIGPAHPEYEGA